MNPTRHLSASCFLQKEHHPHLATSRSSLKALSRHHLFCGVHLLGFIHPQPPTVSSWLPGAPSARAQIKPHPTIYSPAAASGLRPPKAGTALPHGQHPPAFPRSPSTNAAAQMTPHEQLRENGPRERELGPGLTTGQGSLGFSGETSPKWPELGSAAQPSPPAEKAKATEEWSGDISSTAANKDK